MADIKNLRSPRLHEKITVHVFINWFLARCKMEEHYHRVLSYVLITLKIF